MITRHPDIGYLVEYASGSLGLAPCISVTTHLQFCDSCRDQVDALSAIGGEMLATSDETGISDDLLDSVLACIEGEPQQVNTAPDSQTRHDDVIGTLPGYVQKLLPEKLEWRKLSSSLRVAPITVGERQHELALHRIAAGGRAPEHTHAGNELTVVLKGSFSDEAGVYQEGDFLVKGPGDVHRPFAARNEECICLSVLDAPIKLTGVKRVLNPFLRFTPS